MIVLGLSPTLHESAVGILVDGQLLAAASEERFSRVKNQGGFPSSALAYVLSSAGVRAEQVDVVAYAATPFGAERALDVRHYARNVAFVAQAGGPLPTRALHLANYTRGLVRNPEWTSWGGTERAIGRALVEAGVRAPMRYVDHHEAHCASAYFASGFSRCLAVSLDGYGSGKSGSVYDCDGGRMRKVAEIPYPHSLGTFYRRVTQALGFKPNRHEGKIVGLAAFGDPSVLLPEVLARFDLRDPAAVRMRAPHDPTYEARLAKRHRREDVAAAYQAALEHVATRFVAAHLRATGHDRVACAGGVFANVKMNQRIAELPEVAGLFVFPAMGDGGVGVGAAMAVAAEAGELGVTPLRDVYLGPDIDEAAAETALRARGLAFERPADLEAAIVERLVAGKVVCRASGRMEFGPRALGNRSILYPAKDPAVNQWLNDRLRRSEFMPFAPLSRAAAADALYEGIDKVRHAAEFMTVTTRCTARMCRESPAAVHVDGTARPQLVRPDRAPEVHRVLELYEAATGIPTLINTSFNMHEEPIVATAEDAVRAYLDGDLEVLALGPFLVERGSLPKP